jgi:hypothetical protein
MTYGELRERLLAMSEDQLGQTVSVRISDGARSREASITGIGDESGVLNRSRRSRIHLFAQAASLRLVSAS